MSAITKEAGGDKLLTGTVERLGDRLGVDLYYFDATAGRVVRHKLYEVDASPTEMINHISPILVETLTGVSPKEEEKEQGMTDVSFEDGGNFAFAPDAPAPEPKPAPKAEPKPEPVRPAPTPPPQDDFAFLDDEPEHARQITGDPEPLRKNDTPRTRQVDQQISAPPMPEPKPEPKPEPETSDSSFGTTFSFGGIAAEPEPTYDDDPLYTDPLDDEPTFDEEPAHTERATAASHENKAHKGKSAADGEYQRVYISVRGGMSNYYKFWFGAAGAEIGVRATGGLTITLGVDALIVRRAAFDQSGNTVILTNMLYPVKLGILYRFKPGKFQPYAGVDAGLMKIMKDPATNKNEFGVAIRARGGFDYFFTKNFGINLDIGLGVMIGQAWPKVDAREKSVGFYPTGKLGFTFAF